MQNVIVCGAVILNIIYILYVLIIEIEQLELQIPDGVACDKLKSEECSSILWRKIIYKKFDYCNREKCPGFYYCENGERKRKISVWSFLTIFLKQTPAIATLLLLVLKVLE